MSNHSGVSSTFFTMKVKTYWCCILNFLTHRTKSDTLGVKSCGSLWLPLVLHHNEKPFLFRKFSNHPRLAEIYLHCFTALEPSSDSCSWSPWDGNIFAYQSMLSTLPLCQGHVPSSLHQVVTDSLLEPKWASAFASSSPVHYMYFPIHQIFYWLLYCYALLQVLQRKA